jgi:hypothetical protein
MRQAPTSRWLLTAVFCFCPAAVLAAAGQVQFTHGDVRVQTAQGQSQNAAQGMALNEGDVIATAPGSSAQLRMEDGGLISVRPGSQLRIEAFAFNTAEDKSFFALLKGSFRALTGAIGKRNRASWRATTPTATIGIRGSDADIGFDPATQLTGVRTFTGGHNIQPLDGSNPLDTGAGQIGLFTPGAPPVIGSQFPFEPPASRAQAGAPPSPRDQTPAQQQASGAPPAGVRPPPPPPSQVSGVAPKPQGPSPIGGALANGPAPLGNLPPPPPQYTAQAGNLPLSTPNFAPHNFGAVGADMNQDATGVKAGNGAILVDGAPGRQIVLAPDGNVLAVADGAGDFSFAAGTANLGPNATFTIHDATGQAVSAGKWGVWQGPFTVINQGTPKNAISGFHFAGGSNVTSTAQLAALGTQSFTYSQIGGTASNETGALASSFSTSANVTLTPGPTLGTVSMTATASFPTGSTGWNGYAINGTLKDFLGNAGVSGGLWTCTGCIAATNGSVHGQFLGPQAEGLLAGVSASDGVKAMTGTAVLQR